ncbi:unnamed protein product [Clonostachys byssicola]|uniref:Uncharacterized protein n=1 Tax=Clonostachys byssicola TaxID=160290 RepID=A0A9N9Y923_9HYPO|nr:unnamed protein product [Clonostachys byssicola]
MPGRDSATAAVSITWALPATEDDPSANKFDEFMSDNQEAFGSCTSDKQLSRLSPFKVITFLAEHHSAREMLRIIVEGCNKPTFIPVMMSSIDRTVSDETNAVSIEATILANSIQIALFGPTEWDGSPVTRRPTDARWPLKRDLQGDKAAFGPFSWDDVNSVVVLFLYMIARRKSKANMVSARPPPKYKEKDLKEFFYTPPTLSRQALQKTKEQLTALSVIFTAGADLASTYGLDTPLTDE